MHCGTRSNALEGRKARWGGGEHTPRTFSILDHKHLFAVVALGDDDLVRHKQVWHEELRHLAHARLVRLPKERDFAQEWCICEAGEARAQAGREHPEHRGFVESVCCVLVVHKVLAQLLP